MIGSEIGQYRITGKLGTGGMGEVWLAEDTRLERLVALKSLHLHKARDETERERFTREAKAAALINHPHVAQVHEITEKEGRYFIVLEYLDGGSLLDRLEQAGKKNLPLDETLEWMRQTAEGLAEAHSHGIIHRDIKPGNLLLDSHGWVKVTDFGLARLETASRITLSGMTTGTVGDPPSSRRSELPPQLDAVVLRLLQKKPDDRYQDAGEVADELADIQAALGYTPRRDLPGQVSRSGVRASRPIRARQEAFNLKPVITGVLTSLVVAVAAYLLIPGFFQQFENQLYDARVRFALSLDDPYDPGSGLFLIRIDNRAL